MRPLVFRGSYKGISGYSALLRSFLRTADRHQIPYSIISVPWDLVECEIEELERWRTREIEVPLDNSIVLHFPALFFQVIYPKSKNIGYLCWETDHLPHSSRKSWLQGLNQLDEIWTGAEFTKKVLVNDGVIKPVEVVPWGLPTHFPLKSELDSNKKIQGVQIENFKELNVQPYLDIHLKNPPRKISRRMIDGNWLVSLHPFFRWCREEWTKKKQKNIYLKSAAHHLKKNQILVKRESQVFTMLCSNTFDDRKNIKDLLIAVVGAFAGVQAQRIRLIVKTYESSNSAFHQKNLLKEILVLRDKLRLKTAVEIIIVQKNLTEAEHLEFLAIADLFINTSKGEGIGGSVLQSMRMGIPAVTHLFSSIADFCNHENSFVYSYSLEPVVSDFIFHDAAQHWARPNLEDLQKQILKAYNLWKSQDADWKKLQIQAIESAKNYSNEQKIVRALGKWLDS